MTWVKICGITNLEDAQVAVEAGADAVGFVFYEKSPRCVNAATAGEIVAELPAGIEKVGVFVDDPVDSVREIVARTALTAAQLYRMECVVGFLGEREETTAKTRPDIILVASGENLAESELFIAGEFASKVRALLIDSGSAVRFGGTGQRFDWEKARETIEEIGRICPAIVAGGLTPDNVADAIRILRPWGVDVASGVEARPGKKDPDKVRAFVSAVRQAEKNI